MTDFDNTHTFSIDPSAQTSVTRATNSNIHQTAESARTIASTTIPRSCYQEPAPYPVSTVRGGARPHEFASSHPPRNYSPPSAPLPGLISELSRRRRATTTPLRRLQWLFTLELNGDLRGRFRSCSLAGRQRRVGRLAFRAFAEPSSDAAAVPPRPASLPLRPCSRLPPWTYEGTQARSCFCCLFCRLQPPPHQTNLSRHCA